MDRAPVVFVVDDDASVRKALTNLLCSVGLKVQTFATAQEFMSSERPDAPGCLVLDVRLPGVSGLELQRQLAEARSQLPIIFITGHGEIQMSVRAMKAGALEFLTKPVKEQELLDAIQRGIEQHRTRLNERAEITKLQTRYDSLSPRERQVFLLVAEGRLNKQIGAELGVCEKTIKVHRGQVMLKMKADSLAEIVLMAQKLGAAPSRFEAA